LLEGSVQRSGNQVRINAQLIAADTDAHLWAERFDRLLSAEIAEKQARSIKYQLTIAKLPLAKSLPRRRPGTSRTSTSPARRSMKR
jgi:TolB-like protein